ncbi:MAG: hypothetical protein KJ823_00570, partial [Proteobacteria bacterium]|nr:hypothetical protein [Pseudomonadota bacterium]
LMGLISPKFLVKLWGFKDVRICKSDASGQRSAQPLAIEMGSPNILSSICLRMVRSISMGHPFITFEGLIPLFIYTLGEAIHHI